MITYFFIHPNATKYFYRRKSDILEYNLQKLREYSKHDFRMVVDYDNVLIYDATDNRIYLYAPITRDMHHICMTLANLRDCWKYIRHPELITNQHEYNRYVSLLNKYYGN